MKLPELVRNLKRKKLRAGWTTMLFMMAMLSSGPVACDKAGSALGIGTGDSKRVFTRHKVSLIRTLPTSYETRIAKIPGVTHVTSQTWFGGIYRNDPKNFFTTLVVEPTSFFTVFPEFKLPSVQKEEWLKVPHGAIVGEETAKRFGWKVGDTISLTSPIWGEPGGKTQWDFQVVGINTGTKKTTDVTCVYIRYDFFNQSKRQHAKDEVGWFVIRCIDKDQRLAISQEIDNEFSGSPHETTSEPEAASTDGSTKLFGPGSSGGTP
ncbi:MacB-like protein [Roseimicrobium gellanilyticum]|uniref:MacB-like protein n=1 Tax=Roseimicrobium gellanilyticum TaxID=748857 RepID=A0A366HQZ1_9BACT|nr:ABC transporter permease [Roseimicrobium gellanilyticum]RBP46080.1 MacB-like protein [Roseimicrobium gellanilyticum]